MPADVIYTPNPADLPKFLKEIPSLGIPKKVHKEYLKSVGFRSSNHSYIPGVLGRIGFIDDKGVPTDRWKRYRDKSQQQAVMAEAVRETYSDLFATHPDAQNKDNEALRNYFSSKSTAAESMLQRAVGTFKALAGLADFQAAPATEPAQTPEAPPVTIPAASRSVKGQTPGAPLPAVNINIQLQLPETDKPEVYDNFFAAMRKHLFE